MTETQLWSEIWTMAIEVAKVLGKGTLSAGLVTALSWFSTEWILPTLFFWAQDRLTEPVKRGVAFLAGWVMVMVAHGADIVNYGAGPKGWLAAGFFGFLGGGLAPALHGFIQQRFPTVTNPRVNGAAGARP
jgi:hypothetical protein